MNKDLKHTMIEAIRFLYPPQKKITILYGEGADKIFNPLQKFLFENYKGSCYMPEEVDKGLDTIIEMKHHSNVDIKYVLANYAYKDEEDADTLQNNFNNIFSLIGGQNYEVRLVLNCGSCDTSDIINSIESGYSFLKNRSVHLSKEITEIVELVECPISYVIPSCVGLTNKTN